MACTIILSAEKKIECKVLSSTDNTENGSLCPYDDVDWEHYHAQIIGYRALCCPMLACKTCGNCTYSSNILE